MLSPRKWCMGLHPISCPPRVIGLQYLDWREVGLKLLWLVISFGPHLCNQYLHCQNTNVDFHTSLIPLHWTFYPWSSKGALENVKINAWGFLFTHLRGVSPVWCWEGDGQFTLCGASLVSLSSEVCSSRGRGGAPGPLSLHSLTERSLLCRSNEIWLVLVEDSWVSCQLVPHEVGRDVFSNLVFHFIWFLLPPVLHFPPPPVGIGFSQDQVTWFQKNGISSPFVVLLLSLCLCCGLHLSLFKGCL